jgi:CheY-like chemotaxis protein
MSQETATHSHRKLVLVVDDEEGVRQLLVNHMNHEGYEVVAAADGKLALDVIRAREVDVILADLNMPHLGGRGLYEELQLFRRDLLEKFIVLTGTEQDDTVFFETRTRVSILWKPFKLSELSETVHRVLQGYSGRKSGIAAA